MFRKAQQSVAHQSTLPSSFGLGNRDLKSLQDVINTEKDFIKSNNKSAQDFHKVADSFKSWADAEGDDLQDVIGKLSLLLEHYTTSQVRFNAHLSTIRQHFKSIRTREESLADLKSRKRSLGSKIESVEKKLAKMGPENKELMKTTALLKELRNDMESMRVEVQTEEAAIGDFKRRTAKEAMGIKCGGLLEFAEKMRIVAEIGKQMIEEISLDYTHPGMPRADYLGSAKTEQLLQEATRSLADVGFASASAPAGGFRHETAMRGSEWDDSGHDNYYAGGAADVPYPDYDTTQEPDDPHVDGVDTSTTPIYATHSSSVNHRIRSGSLPASNDVVPEDTATDEWRKSQTPDAPISQMQTSYSSTPIADQFASRSPEERQVGGTGLRMVGDVEQVRSTDSFSRLPKPVIQSNGSVAPPRLSTPPLHDTSLQAPEEGPNAPPASIPAPHTPSGAVSSAQDDASYFQAVGSTRAAQQAIRRPISPAGSVNAPPSMTGSFANAGNIPSSPYEPQTEGRKMTAAAFRKGFARAPSAQHLGASGSSQGGAHSGGDHGYGQEDPNATAPLAIRKRMSATPGQTSGLGMADENPAPPYEDGDRHQSVYGGYAGANEYAPAPYLEPSSRPIPGQFYNSSFSNSRPSSAAGYRG